MGTAPLERYRNKRDFSKTREPKGARAGRAAAARRFVVQRHDARRLHYDFRLELDGVLKSWAVPKGPSLDPADKRLAVHVEDHPLEYATFEGTIPRGQYGAGSVAIWDHGTWAPLEDPHRGYAKGHLSFELHGERLRGQWSLVRMGHEAQHGKENWLLIKSKDGQSRRGSRAISSRQAGRKKVITAVPKWIAPQLARPVSALPEGEWAFEIKYDGYRLGARIQDGKVTLYTRSQKDWTRRFGAIAAALGQLPVRNAWLDGEAVIFDEHGRTDFGALQKVLDERHQERAAFVVFDAPFLDGEDMRAQPLSERRKRLEQSLAGFESPHVSLAGQIEGDPRQVVRRACAMRLEGLIAKRLDAPYTGTRSGAWLKLKCRPRDEFVVGGYTEPAGSRVGIGALLVGTFDDGQLRYRGRVGTGFNDEQLRPLRKRLASMEVQRSPFSAPLPYHPKKARIHFVKPELVAELDYAELTSQGILRQASFVGWREDKPARAVGSPAKPAKPAKPVKVTRSRSRAQVPEVAGITISHPERVFSDSDGVTKLDLARYYEIMSERMWPHVDARPLTVVRCPQGNLRQCFFQRHAAGGLDKALTAAKGSSRARSSEYFVATQPRDVIALVQHGAIEFHTWGSSVPRVDRPDRITLDLDPDPALPWAAFKQACELVRALLDHLELRWFLKTTGGKGIHFVIPIESRLDWAEVKDFARGIATHLASTVPSLFTAKVTKTRRRGKVYLDYLRNGEAATAVCAYSVRARAGLPVSMPIAWSELKHDVRGACFNIHNAPARLRRKDPWSEYATTRQRITAAMRKTIGV